MVKVQVIPPIPVEREVVIQMPMHTAALLKGLVGKIELVGPGHEFGEIYRAMEGSVAAEPITISCDGMNLSVLLASCR